MISGRFRGLVDGVDVGGGGGVVVVGLGVAATKGAVVGVGVGVVDIGRAATWPGEGYVRVDSVVYHFVPWPWSVS
jgi:hypothetical protein